MMSFRIHLKRNLKQKRTRIKFDLEKLKSEEKSEEIAESFKAIIGGACSSFGVREGLE